MSEKFNPGFWYSFADAPKVEVPNWIVVTDGEHVVPAFWSPQEVSVVYPEGGTWELLLWPQDYGNDMGDFTHFMMPPKPESSQ